ncbi:MAG: M48 family metalloprotease, partial [Myxococcota bacterium]
MTHAFRLLLHVPKHPMCTLFFVLLLTASLQSCATVQNTLSDGQEIAANLFIPVPEEIKLGQQISAELEQGITLHANPEVQAWARDLGAKLVQGAGNDVSDAITFKFQVIDDPNTINAMALPGGWVYIYSGLILSADNEAEVAAVLGHEVA